MSKQKVALITGITGQDGSYLAELLLQKNYKVHGIIRRCSISNTSRIDSIKDKLELHYGDLTDPVRLFDIIKNIEPDEVYNLAAQSHVGISFSNPYYTSEVNYQGTCHLLDILKSIKSDTKFYQASTSEMFGNSPAPQGEETPMDPQSPYAVAKFDSYIETKRFREEGMFTCNGILFNHESPRRGENFVTRKITLGVANIEKGLQDKLYLGNILAKRDWGYAPEYVEVMWKLMQLDKPEDIVIGTGETHTVQDFIIAAFEYVNRQWNEYVGFEQESVRPKEVNCLQADISKAKKLLNWEPKIKFKELVSIMVEADLKGVKR